MKENNVYLNADDLLWMCQMAAKQNGEVYASPADAMTGVMRLIRECVERKLISISGANFHVERSEEDGSISVYYSPVAEEAIGWADFDINSSQYLDDDDLFRETGLQARFEELLAEHDDCSICRRSEEELEGAAEISHLTLGGD